MIPLLAATTRLAYLQQCYCWYLIAQCASQALCISAVVQVVSSSERHSLQLLPRGMAAELQQRVTQVTVRLSNLRLEERREYLPLTVTGFFSMTVTQTCVSLTANEAPLRMGTPPITHCDDGPWLVATSPITSPHQVDSVELGSSCPWPFGQLRRWPAGHLYHLNSKV